MFSINDHLKHIDIILSEKELLLFEIYLEILQEWNKKINITSIKKTEDIIIKHFIDSLSVLKFIDISGSLVDIGSGGGFPGIPIKIKIPALKLTLIEATRKKSNFLKTVVRTLELEQVEVYNGRAEAFEKENCFDFAISRAFANIIDFCRVACRLVKEGGFVIAMTGKHIEANEKELQTLGLMLHQKFSFELPLKKGERNIVVFRKCFT